MVLQILALINSIITAVFAYSHCSMLLKLTKLTFKFLNVNGMVYCFFNLQLHITKMTDIFYYFICHSCMFLLLLNEYYFLCLFHY